MELLCDPIKCLNPPLLMFLGGDSDIKWNRSRFNLVSSRSRMAAIWRVLRQEHMRV